MFEKELLFLILQALPESIIVTFVCFVLLNLLIEWKKILIIAILETFTNLVHLLPIAFGMHTIILLLALALYIRIVTRAKLSKIFTAIIACYVVVIMSEGIYSKPLLKLFNLSYEAAVLNPVLRAVFSIPAYVALLLIPMAKKTYTYFKQKIILLEDKRRL